MLNIELISSMNGSAFVLMLIILQSSYRVFNHKLLDHQLMNIMIETALIGCVLETTAYLFNGVTGQGNHVIEIVVSALAYICNSLFALIWTIYADYKLFGDIDRLKKRYSVLAIPAILIVLCSIINLFTPVFFTVDKVTNIYQRSPLYIIPNIVALFYLAYGTVLIYKYRNKVGKYLFFPVIIFMIPIICAAVLDYLFYGMAFKQMGIAISLTSIYINMQKEISYTDCLSGLFTREYIINYLTMEINHYTPEKPIAGILMDIDQFKSINDTYGHLAGDDAIRSFGQILREVVSKDDMAVRFAGDEFMVIHKFTNELEIKNLIESIRTAIQKLNTTQNKPYTIQFSAGYSIFDRAGDTMDTFFERMDSAMYTEKRMKQKSPSYLL